MTTNRAPEGQGLLEGMERQGHLSPAGKRQVMRWIGSGNSTPEDPEELFGPWDDLPEEARSEIKRLLEAEIREGTKWLPESRLWVESVHWVFTLAGRFRRRGFEGPARHLSRFGERVWGGPRAARVRLRKAARLVSSRWRIRLTLQDLLGLLGKDAHWLAGSYAKGIEVPPAGRGFYADPRIRWSMGYLVGLDLIHSPEEIWCVEANLSPALRENRNRFYSREPVADGLLDFAEREGYRRLVWLGAPHTPLNPWLLSQLARGSKERGILFELREDPRVPGRHDLPDGAPPPIRTVFPPRATPDTLVVRLRGTGAGSDFVISHKATFLRGLAKVLKESPSDRVRVPAMTRHPPHLSLTDDGLPNLVYKYPHLDKGQGVFFMRARSPAHAVELARSLDGEMDEAPGFFQPYLLSRLLPGRRFYDVRALLFVCPSGVVHLGALRKESSRPIPTTQADGVIEDRRPFSMSPYFGNDYSPLGADEVDPLKDAAIAVGESIQVLLRRGFVTGP